MIKLELLKVYNKLNVMELELGLDWEGTKQHMESKLKDLYSLEQEEKEIIIEMEEFIQEQIINNVESFIGANWEYAGQYLKGYITVDKDNIDNKTGECIVDFTEEYSDLSISGKIVNDELIIEDEALIYKNN